MNKNFLEAKAVLSDVNCKFMLCQNLSEVNRSCLLINRSRSAAAFEKVFTTNNHKLTVLKLVKKKLVWKWWKYLFQLFENLLFSVFFLCFFRCLCLSLSSFGILKSKAKYSTNIVTSYLPGFTKDSSVEQDHFLTKVLLDLSHLLKFWEEKNIPIYFHIIGLYMVTQYYPENV